MSKLSFTAHLSNGKNAVTTKGKLADINKHNLRKYQSSDYDRDNIVVLKGSDSIVRDVKEIYIKEFKETIKKYNENQTREERKINNYYEKMSESSYDIAAEIIIQIGDKQFWDENENLKMNMVDAYKGLLDELSRLYPNYKIASAIIHFDEASPHMHIVGVPIAEGYAKGLEKRVSKSKIFTKTNMIELLQGKLREYASEHIDSWLGQDLKEKSKGRNYDLTVLEYKVLKENEKKEKLEKNNEKIKKDILINEIKQTIAERTLIETYEEIDVRIKESEKEIEEIKDVEKIGEDEINKFRSMLRNVPAPKGLMSIKTYQEKEIIPFLKALANSVMNIIDYAKSCFVELKKVKKELGYVIEDRNNYRNKCKSFEKRMEEQNNTIMEQEKEIEELLDSNEKLGFFKRFLKPSVYESVIESGEREKDKNRDERKR